MTKEQFKEWFITTNPHFAICDDIVPYFPKNDGTAQYLCGSPAGLIVLNDEEMQECYEARWEAWNKKTE